MGDAVHGVDVVQALGAVEIALVHAVDADEAGTAVRGRCPTHADGDGLGRPGLGQHHPLGPVAGTAPQVVEMRHRQRRQPCVARIAMDLVLAAQHAGSGWPGEGVHGPVDLGEQGDVGGRVLAREGVRRCPVAFTQRRSGAPALHQPRDLGAAVAAQVLQVGKHRAPIRALELAISQALEHRCEPFVTPGIVVGAAKLQRHRARKHFAHLDQRANLRLVHVNHHGCDDRPGPPIDCRLQAHTSLESARGVQAHTSLDKTPS